MLSSKVLSLTYNIGTLRSVKKKPLHQIYYVPRVEFNSYEGFFSDYFIKNKPCVLSASNTESWKSVREWVASDGKPNFELLEKLFGAAVVPVADCNVKEYNSQRKQDMLFKDYLDYWQNMKYECNQNPPCLYLKDWHFVRDFPDYDAYKTPEYFTSDWLNEFCEHENDDYRFVYMGPRGTWTPLHVDVFGSYSWSANICGKKKWILFPPGNEKHLHDNSEKMAYSVDVVANKVESLTSDLGIEVIQEPGEIIFVPSGWYHQVWNIEDTISINHNWFNGCNIKYVWECLDRAAQEVEDEIVDCKEMEGWDKQCQMSDGRKRFSGAEYGKRRTQKEENVKTFATAISNFFASAFSCTDKSSVARENFEDSSSSAIHLTEDSIAAKKRCLENSSFTSETLNSLLGSPEETGDKSVCNTSITTENSYEFYP